MRKLCSFSLIFIVFLNSSFAQLLMDQPFDALTNGSLSGQATWTTVNGSTLVINVASASPITGCSGGGSKYVQPGTAATNAGERLSFPTATFTANTNQVFYLSFLMNISNAGNNVDAHIVSLGNSDGGGSYEYSRIHIQQSGTGYKIGISNGSVLAGASASITWGTAVLYLNQTYHIVLRYDYNDATFNDDVMRVWVNPGITSGSEPATGSAQAVINGDDNMLNGDNVRNVYLNYYSASSPVYKIDQMKYARASTSATAWSNLSITGSCVALPLKWLSTGATLNQQSEPLIRWKVEEVNVQYYVIEQSITGKDYIPIDTMASRGDGLHDYVYTHNQFLTGSAYYRIKQVDIDGKYSYSAVLYVKGKVKEGIMVYPNPLKQVATLYISDRQLMNTAAYVCDMNGQVLKKIMITKTTTHFDMQPFAAGTYFVKLKNGENIRFMKE